MTRSRGRRAIVIGSGPNALAGAITLASAGLEVEVYEAEDTIGGGTRSLELTLPGFAHDICSAIHPLAKASPFFRQHELEIEWVHAPAPAAHPLDDGTAVVLERSIDATAPQLAGDAAAYRRVFEPLAAAWDAIEPIIIGPYPPPPRRLLELVRALRGSTVGAALGGLATARSFAQRTFETERARAFFAGHAAHSMLPLERRPSAGFGLTLSLLGHVVGWPFPRGGSQRIADALVTRLLALGGAVHRGTAVDQLPAADIVLADVSPRELVRLAGGRFPERYARSLLRYRHGPGAFKLDWALAGRIPWRAAECRRAATIHLGGSLDEMAASERAAWTGRPSERPFVILAQQTLFDATRAPSGRHTAWAYCHVPNSSTADMTEAIEAQVERFAPGFRDRILARSALPPQALEQRNRNLVGGDLNGGAMDLPQLVFRPARRLVPYATPLPGVFICSSATPPGGGVHGMCGYAAALAALKAVGSAPRRPCRVRR